MSPLLTNAIASIRMGVEDFANPDADRALSAVRNFYSGVLLLAKAALVEAVPEADMDEILAARHKPVPDGRGGVAFIPDGYQTVDFHTLGQRFKAFNLSLDTKLLDELGRIRNAIEHRYSDQGDEAVREAIARAFPVVADLFRQLDVSPAQALDQSWQTMLETRHLYERQLSECRSTFSQLIWFSPTIANADLLCTECGSGLVEQSDPDNTSQGAAAFRCRACGNALDTEKMIVEALSEALAAEGYLRAKDAGEDGPIHPCPECMNESYVDFEDCCASCGHEIGDRSCIRCGAEIPIDEVAYGDGDGLCSYCAHMAEKIMRE